MGSFPSIIDGAFDNSEHYLTHWDIVELFVPYCKDQALQSNCKLSKKNPQVLIIIREGPKNNPLILRNLDNFLPGTFYSTPPPPPPPSPFLLQLRTKLYHMRRFAQFDTINTINETEDGGASASNIT